MQRLRGLRMGVGGIPAHTAIFPAAVLLLLSACGDGDGSDPDPMEPSDTPPTVVITAPAGSSAFVVGEPVTLQGTVTDTEDGTLPDASLRWSSDVDGELGAGATVVVDDLSVAEHRIVLSATDSDGRTGSDTVQISVTAPEVDRTLTDDDLEAGFVIGQVLVRYSDDPVGADVLAAVAEEHGFLWQEPLPGLGAWLALVDADANGTVAVAEALAGDGRVAEAGVDALAHTADVPGDFDPEGDQYHLPLTGVDVYWRGLDAGAVAGEGVTVAIIDYGFDVDAGDVETGGRSLVAPAFVPGATEPIRTGRAEVVASNPADNAHGTHVASLVAGGGDDGDGLVGLAPGARVMPVRVAPGADRFVRFSTLARALGYAAVEAPDVVLLPLAASPSGRNRGAAGASGLTTALETLVDVGAEVVVPAGNCALPDLDPDCGGAWSDVNLFGTLAEEVWAVGATDDGGAARWERSGRGPSLDLVAPGVAICAASSLGCADGTSLASAVVAGLVALHRAAGVTDGLAALLRDHSVRLDLPVPSEETGYGRSIAGIGLDALDPPTVTAGVPTTVTLVGRNFDLGAEVWIDGEQVPVDPADRSPGFDAISVEYTASGTDPVPVRVVHPRGELASEVRMLEVEGALPGKIFVNHDDWPFRPTGFTKSPDAARFAQNLASWFTGGGTGKFLAFSADLALAGPELAGAMTTAGHGWTVSTSVPFSMPELLEYDGIFLAGTPASKDVLTEYALAGGNVYLGGGTGIGTAEEEAEGWAPFLNAFGLRFAPEYNAVDGVVPTCSDHPVFAGVDDLYFQNGSSVSEIDPGDPNTDVLQVEAGVGLFAIYDVGGGRSREVTAIEVAPEGPVTLQAIGATRALQALAIGESADDCSGAIPGVTFEWSTDDPDVAKVDADGTVEAVGEGSAKVTASRGGVVSNAVTINVVLPAFRRAPRMFAGGEASCALLPDAALWCWGDGDEGAGFGNATGDETSTPVRAASGFLFEAFSLDGHGVNQACGIDFDGQAYCWGGNFNGQIGDGSTTERTIPTPVAGDYEFAAIANGETHTCALATDGSAYCWGDNDDGQLGDGTLTTRLTPVPVSGGRTFTAIDAGDDLTCGLDSTGAALCWGENADGQLGNGSTVSASVPTPVEGGLTFEHIEVGRDHVCALTPDGTGYCWGFEGEGKLGDGSIFEDRTVPTMVAGGLRFSWISAGVEHTCGVATSGEGYCWGEGEDYQLGDGSRNSSAVPVEVQGGITFAEIAAGEDHTCGRAVDGSHYCWGSDAGGTIGDGQPLFYSDPNPVVGGLTFTALASGSPRCGIDPEGRIHCWGGDDGPSPVLVAPAEAFEIVAGSGEVCALTTAGVAYCRGEFDPAFELVPAGGLTFASIDADVGGFWNPTRCALTGAGDPYCWGEFNGEESPAPVTASGPWSAIAVGSDQDVCGLDESGTAQCWGYNVGFQGFPAAVDAGPPFVSVSVGVGHACALTAGGAAYCWGRNYAGQLGDGTTEDPPYGTPVAVAGGLTFESIWAGFADTCAVAAGGEAYCWGIYFDSDMSATTPTPLPGGLSFVSVGSGCGLTTAGEAYCWGYGGDDVGDGLGSSRATPTLVQFPGG